MILGIGLILMVVGQAVTGHDLPDGTIEAVAAAFAAVQMSLGASDLGGKKRTPDPEDQKKQQENILLHVEHLVDDLLQKRGIVVHSEAARIVKEILDEELKK